MRLQNCPPPLSPPAPDKSVTPPNLGQTKAPAQVTTLSLQPGSHQHWLSLALASLPSTSAQDQRVDSKGVTLREESGEQCCGFSSRARPREPQLPHLCFLSSPPPNSPACSGETLPCPLWGYSIPTNPATCIQDWGSAPEKKLKSKFKGPGSGLKSPSPQTSSMGLRKFA